MFPRVIQESSVHVVENSAHLLKDSYLFLGLQKHLSVLRYAAVKHLPACCAALADSLHLKLHFFAQKGLSKARFETHPVEAQDKGHAKLSWNEDLHAAAPNPSR